MQLATPNYYWVHEILGPVLSGEQVAASSVRIENVVACIATLDHLDRRIFRVQLPYL